MKNKASIVCAFCLLIVTIYSIPDLNKIDVFLEASLFSFKRGIENVEPSLSIPSLLDEEEKEREQNLLMKRM